MDHNSSADYQGEPAHNPDGSSQRRVGSSFAVLVIAFAVILGFAVWAGYVFVNSSNLKNDKKFSINTEFIKNNETVAALAADLLKKQMDAILVAGVAYAKKPELIKLIQQDDWGGAVRNMAPLAKENFLDHDQARILLADVNGVLKADFPELPGVRGQNFAFRDWYRGVTRDFQPYLSEVYTRTAKPAYNVVAFAFPIKDNKDVPIGILAMQIKTDMFLTWLRDIKFGQSGYAFIVDQRGRVIAHPDIASQGPIVDLSAQSEVQKVVSGQKGTEISLNDSGFVSSFEPVAGYHWGVIAKIKVDEVKKNQISSGNSSLLSGSPLFIVIISYIIIALAFGLTIKVLLNNINKH